MKEAKVVLLPFIRNRSLGVRGTLDRFSSATSVVLTYLRVGVIGAALVLLYYLFTLGFGLQNDMLSPTVLGFLPNRPWTHWAVLIVVLAVFARLLHKTAKILRSG
jgi:hypothetical protein